MREILITLGSVAAALIIVGVIVFGARDGALFVPPPEAVAENFGRALASGRYGVARRYLSGEQRRQQSAGDLETRFGPWKVRMGAVDDVEARELSSDGDRARAGCELKGERSAVALTMELTREHGLWAIESWEAAPAATR